MKVNKFILAGVAVLGLGMTACNNDDVPPVGDPTGGSTFVGKYNVTKFQHIVTIYIVTINEYTNILD